jgi:hypothetical protein
VNCSANCQECNGSGACDPCDGYGFYPDSYPGAGDGPECEICESSGCCPDCDGTGTKKSIKQESGIEQGSDVSVG